MALTFYRIVKNDPPTDQDFLSYLQLGKAPLSDDPRIVHQAEGVSVYGSFENARNQAIKHPYLGSFVAELSIPDGAPVTCAPIGGRAGHNTIWTDSAQSQAATLRSYVVNVVSVH